MAGGSSQKKPTAKRWMLRSPKEKPRANATGNVASDLQRVQPAGEPHRVVRRSESFDGMNLQRQEYAQQTALTDQPDAAKLCARLPDTEAASCPDEECPTSITSAAGSSVKRVYTAGKTSGSRSPSPKSQPRGRSPISIAGIMKRFRRGKLPKHAVNGGVRSVGQQRSSAGVDSSSTDTNNRKVNTPPLHRGGGEGASEQASATEKNKEKDEAILPAPVLQRQCGSKQMAEIIREGSISISCRASCSDVGGTDQCKSKHVVAQPPPAVQRGMSRDQARSDVGADALAAVKNGQQPPRIAFIGVFLSGVAVALASFVPFGSAAARTALVKAVLLEPSTSILPGGCYTARGSVLAVHIVVDHKHRVYACVAAEDVPFSLALSLLEEVQIEYISTTSTLAFSTKENSHNSRCHAHIARSWAKYEAVEHTLVRERETRRRLGEAPLDIERPLSRDNKSYSGAEVVPLYFSEEHQPALLDAELEISSLLEEDKEQRCARDVACGEVDRAANVVRKKRKRMTRTAVLLATGVSIILGASYAARRAYLSF